ncbi:MAG: alpha/beta hydrolase [Pseudomonadota bacterium]
MTFQDTLKTVDVHGVETRFFEWGSGPDLLYLHGAATLEGFNSLMPLTEQFRVIAPYHPGFGPGQDGRGLMGSQDLIVHYADFIDALNLEPPHVLGFSMGGWIAAELAVFFGSLLGAIALIAPAGLRTNKIPCPDLIDIAPLKLPGYLTHNPAIAASYFPGGDNVANEDDFVEDRAREAAAQDSLEQPFGMGHPNMGRWLHRITNPVKLYWGAEDRMVPPAYAERWTAHLPQAELALIEGAGHLAMNEQPSRLFPDVENFFRAHSNDHTLMET